MKQKPTAKPLLETPAGVLEAILSNTTDAIWVIDAERRLIHFNRSFIYYCREWFGQEPAVGHTLADLIPDRPKLRAYWSDLFDRTLSGRPVSAEGTLRLLDVTRYFTISSTPVRRGSEVEGATFSVRDITEFRRHASHEFFGLMLARLFTEDASLEVILRQVLEAFCLSVGWDVGVAWLVNVETERLEVAAIWHRPTVEAPDFEQRLLRTTFTKGHGLPGRAWAFGDALWFENLHDETTVPRTVAALELGLRGSLLFPIRDSREVIGICEFMTVATRVRDSALVDVLSDLGQEIGRFIERHRVNDERKKLQDALERKSAEWSTTFDTIDAPIIVLDGAGRILRLNRAARDFSDVAEYRDLVGHSLREIGSADHWRIINELFTSVRDSRTSVAFQLFDEVTRKYWDMSADLAEVGDDDKVIVVMRDITRLVELQESVRRGEQLSAMGELVAGVAHEVRNPLFGIGATIDTMQMTLGEVDADTTMLFDALRQWVRRLTSLMEHLLEYGKAWSVNLEQGDVEEVIQQAIDISQSLADGADVTLEYNRPEDKATILLDPARLLQVFQNLIMNAIQHSPAGSRVTITCEVVAGREVRCSIRDHGPGFAKRDFGKIFQPFYTTRRGGTGLGLSIVQRVVDEHGGTIDAKNHPDGGAFLQVHFPLTEEARS